MRGSATTTSGGVRAAALCRARRGACGHVCASSTRLCTAYASPGVPGAGRRQAKGAGGGVVVRACAASASASASASSPAVLPRRASSGTFVVTTPLYYANAAPHMGSAYPTIAADALARFRRMRGGERVRFVTGTDEHGEKIAEAAARRGLDPHAHCDEIVQDYKSLWSRLEIDFDSFVRTTDTRHARLVNAVLERVWAKGDIYEAEYEGVYCVGCEEYKDEKELEEGGVCPIHKTACDQRRERNYFFRLSRYQREIEELLEEDRGFVMPAARRNEVLGWVRDGLRDFSISRAAVSWGIPVARDPEQTVYVWFDALLGYVSALAEAEAGEHDGPREEGSEEAAGDAATADSLIDDCVRAGWPATLHIIGKDILRFHAVYWPAMLMSAGLELPACVFGHGFLTKDGLKMGKSLGNVLHPNELVDRFGADAVRFYFLCEMEFGKDGDFSEARFVDKVNASLANDVGNLLNRTLKMLQKNCGGVIPCDIASLADEHPIRSVATAAVADAEDAYDAMRFHGACAAALSVSGECNRYLEERQPWTMLKKGSEEEKAEAAQDLAVVLEATRIVAHILWPIVPSMAQRIFEQLAVPVASDAGAAAARVPAWDDTAWGGLNAGHEISKDLAPVFMRLEGAEAVAPA